MRDADLVEVVVARIGRPHGVRGDVTVEVRTDVPEQRFVVGASFTTDPPGAGPLRVRAARAQPSGWVLTFDDVVDRGAAEGLRGVLLLAHVPRESDDDTWAVGALVGLAAVLTDGRAVGTVVALEHGPAQDLLVIEQPSGTLARVPFVRELVPLVDVPGGRVVLDPPGGLLDDADLPDGEGGTG